MYALILKDGEEVSRKPAELVFSQYIGSGSTCCQLRFRNDESSNSVLMEYGGELY